MKRILLILNSFLIALMMGLPATAKRTLTGNIFPHQSSQNTTPSDTVNTINNIANNCYLTFNVEYSDSLQGTPKEGKIVILLYPDSNLNSIRNNFIQLAKTNAYDNILFHRVINDFMIQCGDPASKNAKPGELLGNNSVSGNGITETSFVSGQLFQPNPRFHKRYAVAIARVGDEYNRGRRGSSSQFYIVTDHGTYTEEQLMKYFHNRRQKYQKFQNDSLDYNVYYSAFYRNEDVKLPQEVINAYSEIGGAPYLDEDYVVVGEVVEGKNVVDEIQNLNVDQNARPTGYARIKNVRLINKRQSVKENSVGQVQQGSPTRHSHNQSEIQKPIKKTKSPKKTQEKTSSKRPNK